MLGGSSSIKVHLYSGGKLKFKREVSVLSVLQECASETKVSPYYFRLFLLRSKTKVLLPYRSHFPFDNEEDYYFTLIADLPLSEVLHGDIECFRYYFNQCKEFFLESVKKEAIQNVGRLQAILFAVFARSNGLSMKRPDIKKTLRKYNLIFKTNLDEECSSELDNIDPDRCTAIRHMQDFIQGYLVHKEELETAFNKFVNVEVLFEGETMKGTVLLNKATIEFWFPGKITTEVDLKYIDAVSSGTGFAITLTLSSKMIYHLNMINGDSYESFLSLFDRNARLYKGSSCLKASVHDIPFLIGDCDSKYNLISLPVRPFCDVSAKELTLAIEIYGKHCGWYGIIEKRGCSNMNSIAKDVFWVLIYCIENTIYEKIICCTNDVYHFEDNQYICYTSLSALVRLCKLRLSTSGSSYSLTTQITEDHLIDIQDPEVSKLFIPQASLEVLKQDRYMSESWMATICKGRFSKSSEVRMVTYFSYKNWGMTDEDRKEFISHASILAKIQTENILHILGVCTLLESKNFRFITEDIPFYTLHEHLKTDYIPRCYTHMEYDRQLSESSDEGTTFTLLFKYVRYIVAGLQYLHSHEICHTFPAPQHILVDKIRNNLKLFDVGIFGKFYKSCPDHGQQIVLNSAEDGVSVLRWMSYDCILNPQLINTAFHDRWVFACTVWQIFNNSGIPLLEYSNDELLSRYMEIKKYQCGKDNVTMQGLCWFQMQLEMPKQSLKLNKMLQELVNYILNDYVTDYDQENVFGDIADLYNTLIFPADRDIDVYEKIDGNTKINLRRGSEGKLVFEKDIKSKYPELQNILMSSYNETSDCNDYDFDDSDFTDDCENSEPERDNDYERDQRDYGYEVNENYDTFNLCLDAESSEPAFDHSPILLAKLLNFNNEKWESSYYTLKESIGSGNFGVVRKAIVQQSDKIPPELHGRAVAVKTFELSLQSESIVDGICKEALAMSKLEHNKIVPFYGISTTEDLKEIHIIMPFYPFGCLKKYIANYHNELRRDRMISFGLQIADGMEYISSQGFVHRDLALRNILVEGHTKVRIADLGLTRGVDKEANYYYLVNKSSKNGLPVMSYPLEFFTNDFKYDKYCDVWSYGVTCFELWSYGKTPYLAEQVTNSTELVEFLRLGHRLDIPPATPDIYEHVMKKCWLPKRDRWNFKDILNYIKNNVVYFNPSAARKRLQADVKSLEGEETIYTSVKQSDGSLALQTIPVKQMDSLKRCKLFNIKPGRMREDIQNTDSEILYDEVTVSSYDVVLSGEYLNKILSIKNRHVMQILGYACEEGLLHTVSPVHSLGSLHDYCSKTKAENINTKYMYCTQVLKGMLFLLSENIVHGSLSIHNVWLRTKECAVVSDMGITQNLTMDQTTQHTIVTYPPEVLDVLLTAREAKLDEKSDLWMFGIMLLQVFSVFGPYTDLHPANVAEKSREFKVALAENIVLFLRSYRPGLNMAMPNWPSEVKNALNVCFVDIQTRGTLLGIKKLLQCLTQNMT